MITVTQAATSKIKEVLEEENDPTLVIRAFVEGGGCSGFQYQFMLEDMINEDDFKIEQDGATLVVDAMSMQYMQGATLDYVDDLSGSHFKIINPNASTTCGCGSSFSV